MRDDEVAQFLEAAISGKLADWSEKGAQGLQAAAVTCMDGRLNQFLRPFRHVVRTAGAAAEAVEGSIGLAAEATDVIFLVMHGDCLAYQAGIHYLAGSFAGRIADSRTVSNLNRHDTKALLTAINGQRHLNALPAPTDQKALAELAIGYAIQWTARNEGEKPRVGLFIDENHVLSPKPQPWVVSYGRHSGPELGRFLSTHGMSQQFIAAHVLQEPMAIGMRR